MLVLCITCCIFTNLSSGCMCMRWGIVLVLCIDMLYIHESFIRMHVYEVGYSACIMYYILYIYESFIRMHVYEVGYSACIMYYMLYIHESFIRMHVYEVGWGICGGSLAHMTPRIKDQSGGGGGRMCQQGQGYLQLWVILTISFLQKNPQFQLLF